MSILKLPNVGDTATLTITLCAPVKGQYGMQVRFDGVGGNSLFLPADSANRQLLRCGYEEVEQGVPDYDTVVGDTLTFSRSENPKPGAKPYWNIEIATPADAAPKAPSKRLQGPPAPEVPGHDPEAPPPDDAPATGQPEAIDATADGAEEDYALALWRRVAIMQAEVGRELDLPVDGTSVSRFTATILIDRQKRAGR